MSVRREVEKLGWRIRYVPHKVIEDHNACYRVVYGGKVIHPPAADKLGISLNEIWLSEKLREYEEYVLFHELREIQYRHQGYSIKEAHLRARVDEALRFCDDPKWAEYFEKFPDHSLPLNCLQELCNTIKKSTKKHQRPLQATDKMHRQPDNLAPHQANQPPKQKAPSS